MIELSEVSVHSGAFQLERVSLRVDTGQFAVLMGQTGQGKTTLLEAICGLRPVTGGKIVLAERDVTRLTPGERNVGYVPQDLALFPTLTVREHLEFALRIRRQPGAKITARVDELAHLLNIEPLLARLPERLSGGESQRVALGRALSFAPPVLLLDEPFSALDEEIRLEMWSLLARVQQQTGVTVLHVTHSRAEARALASQLLTLRNGVLQSVPLDYLDRNTNRDDAPDKEVASHE